MIESILSLIGLAVVCLLIYTYRDAIKPVLRGVIDSVLRRDKDKREEQ